MRIKLSGITWDHPRAYDPLVATSAEFARLRHDVEIEWDKRPLQAFADHPIDDLAAKYDLLIVDHPHVGSAAQLGCLVPLDQGGDGEQLATLARQTIGRSHESYVYHGRQWALAVDAAAQVAAFRPDLLGKNEVPQTWEATVELAQEGRVLWPIKPVDCMMSLLTLAANRGTPCCDGPQLIDRSNGLAVLTAMHTLSRYVPRFCLDMNPIQVAEKLAGGDRYCYSPLLFGYSNYARDGFRPHFLQYTNIPALGHDGPCGAILGGAGIAVSAQSRAINVAVDFAFWVCAAECQAGIYFQAGGQPGNAAAWDEPSVNDACHNFFTATRETLDRSYLRPRYDGFLELQQQGGDIVHALLSDKIDAEQAMTKLERAYLDSRERTSSGGMRDAGCGM